MCIVNVCRRLKKEVITQLPDKVRQMVLLDPGLIKTTKEMELQSKTMELKSLKVKNIICNTFKLKKKRKKQLGNGFISYQGLVKGVATQLLIPVKSTIVLKGSE